MNPIVSQFFTANGLPFHIFRIIHDFDRFPQKHDHAFVEFVYVVSGEAVHCFEGEQYDIQSGDAFFINPGEIHSYDFKPGQQIEIINCLFMPALIRDTLLHELGVSQSMDFFYVQPFLDKEERFHHRLNLRGHEAVAVLAILEDMITEITNKHSGYDKVILLRMMELILKLSRYNQIQQSLQPTRRQEERDIMVKRLRGYLERYYNQKISLEKLSVLFNISIRQMNRLVKQEIGVSIIEWLHQIRIERAKSLLTGSDEKVISVANMVGYDDPAFFSTLFTRLVGCPPGKYRENTR